MAEPIVLPTHKQFNNLMGQRFGCIVVESFVGKKRWICRCKCGKIMRLYSSEFKHGNRRCEGTHQECHGKTNYPEYAIWCGSIKRCTNPRSKSFPIYGGRGIVICDRWRHSFDNFYADMGPRPSPKHSIDRIDNNKGYEPGNCWWATRKEQNRNQQRNHNIEYLGRTMCLTDWAKECGLNRGAFTKRLNRGWSMGKILSTPAQLPKNRNNVNLSYLGKTMCAVDWENETGIPSYVIRYRLSRGWSPEKTLTTPPLKFSS